MKMDKQRDIYRQLIVKLFKANFDAALFQEKRDEMMKDTDFECIRDEIEEEYFTKNRGIAPYSVAIKYLCTKIEACTSDNVLFMAIEDYICVKENIAVTKIVKDKVQVTDLPDAVKCKKRKGKKPSANVQSENPSAHAKCNSPQSCKKCRIMRRLNRSESKPRIQNKKPSKSISIEQMTEKITIEKSKPKYSDISDSESASLTHENHDNSIKSTVCVSQTKNETKSITHFPHSDHQYSRISFYGSGSNDSENLSKHEPSKAIAKEQITVPNKTQNPYAAPNRSVCIGSGMLQTKQIQVVRPKPVIYRFRPNTDVRQPTPAYFMPHFISNSSTTFTQTSQVVRSIHKPNSSTQTIMPTQFRSPTTILHRPEIHHPIYYVSFCEPQMLQRYSNHN